MIRLHNTLTGHDDKFAPLNKDQVTIYTCGPTVYDYLHVGNWSAYIYWDSLVRLLSFNNYRVNRVMNITDVGHLVSDADDGEDKLEKGARREGKTAWDVAEFYGQDFLAGMKQLNLVDPTHTVKATDFIDQQLDLIRSLKAKGYTYQIDDGIYFDTAKFPNYANFAHLDLAAQQAGARVSYNSDKRNPSDFALWKFSPQDEKRDMEWATPADLLDDPLIANSDDLIAKMGFPGWHLECSAMAMDLLGNTIDIHTGGIDHIPVHHTNEIAQSEAASGQRFANYWMHANHLKVDGTKISKSLGNGYTLADIAERGYSPLDLRLAVLQGHYRSEGNFTFDSLESARNRRANWQAVAVLRHQTHDSRMSSDQPADAELTSAMAAAIDQLNQELSADLNTPKALQVVDAIFSQLESAKLDDIDRSQLNRLLAIIDKLLGLKLVDTTPDIDDDAKQLLLARQAARAEKDWDESDTLRDQLLKVGIAVRDTSGGVIWHWQDARD